jgi:hypothetical protein
MSTAHARSLSGIAVTSSGRDVFHVCFSLRVEALWRWTVNRNWTQ